MNCEQGEQIHIQFLFVHISIQNWSSIQNVGATKIIYTSDANELIDYSCKRHKMNGNEREQQNMIWIEKKS